MSIPTTVLKKAGARSVKYKARGIIFGEGDQAQYYFQLQTGVVKMINEAASGEYIQGFFTDGESFGEPPLFCDFDYPATAVAVAPSVVWMLNKQDFLQLMQRHNEYLLLVTRALCQRLRYKNLITREMASSTPAERILQLLHYFAQKDTLAQAAGQYRVPFTRQQIADMIGLRVETVIRTIRQCADNKLLEIVNGKVVLHLSVAANNHL